MQVVPKLALLVICAQTAGGINSLEGSQYGYQH